MLWYRTTLLRGMRWYHATSVGYEASAEVVWLVGTCLLLLFYLAVAVV